jgi:hypothetical protein
MLNFQDVQREVGHQNVNGWEEIWYSLAVADGYRAGVPLSAFHWDWRTSAKDGGRDLVVDSGAGARKALFTPDRAAVWSIKSGANGVSASTLRAELDGTKHAKLVTMVQSGHVYVYCLAHPAGHDEREALRTAADECCTRLGLKPDSIKLLFDNHLCDGLKAYPAVLKQYCPQLARIKAQTRKQWGRPRPHFDTQVAYVDFADRRDWIERLVLHFGSTDDTPVLHIAGLSGIGKTRLVFEACSDPRLPDSVLYFESYLDCMDLVQRLMDDESLSVRFVVDEVSVDQHVELRNKLHGFGSRVRAVSIGPAGRRDESRDTIAILAPPDTTNGVLAVLQKHAPATVPPSGLEYIAEQCNHDLRFALLMVRAVQKDIAILNQPGELVKALSDTKSLYGRVLTLFANTNGADLDPGFRERYPWLTLAALVGVKSPRKHELEFISERASIPLIDMEKTVAQAIGCGLGDQPAHLFEAVPRGMATKLFADVLWPTIKLRFDELLKSAPDPSFVQSIMQRVEMCPEGVRKEVTSRLDSHFRSQLGPSSISALDDAVAARTLRSWAELSPESGLPWLRRAIEHASLDDLRHFEGAGRSGWTLSGPRRQVVWLLAHLSCFAEYFESCEAMLFRLAQSENEKIGNNATATWTEKFRIYLSNTQMPYLDRVTILMSRLADARKDTIELLMEAFVACVSYPHSAMAPPVTVGGRLVPPEWRPTNVSIYELFTRTIIEGLQRISQLEPEPRMIARRRVIAELPTFYKESTHAQLMKLFNSDLESEERLSLCRALEDLRRQLAEDSDAKVVALAERVSRWLAQVAPSDLAEQVRLAVGRPPWSYGREEDGARDGWKGHYRALVVNIRMNVAVLNELADWLDKSNAKGLWSFGWMLAAEGNSGEFHHIVNAWLSESKCLEVCGGYLTSWHASRGELPDWTSDTLNRLVASAPYVAASMTIAVDASIEGWRRVERSLETDRTAVLPTLGQMFGERWEQVLGASGQAWVLDQLWPESESRDLNSGITALHLFELYRHGRAGEDLPVALLPPTRRLVLSPPDLHRADCASMWKDAAIALANADPVAVIPWAVELALNIRVFSGSGSREAVACLKALTGKHDYMIVEAILEALQRLSPLILMDAEALQDLFGAMKAETVIERVDTRGLSAARLIGACIPDPSVASDGSVALPNLTEWYMRRYGDDSECFRQFCLGRWSGRVQVGWAWERQGAIDSIVKAYSKHSIPSLRRWVEEVQREHAEEIERHRIEYEEDKRR